MSQRVWVYPERQFEELGATRYQVSWEEVKPASKGKDDIDPDEDIIYRFANYKTKEAAMKKARQVVDGFITAYGGASVEKQVVDWFVREDRVAEWQDAGEREVVD